MEALEILRPLVGCKFVHKWDYKLVYTLARIYKSTGEAVIEWNKTKDSVCYTIEDAAGYFTDGTWIKL